uniref:Uncharacterized protein n=1 Tax=Zea mays TaxID=4577 RepID=A0A804UG07_MAIZE
MLRSSHYRVESAEGRHLVRAPLCPFGANTETSGAWRTSIERNGRMEGERRNSAAMARRRASYGAPVPPPCFVQCVGGSPSSWWESSGPR